MDYEWVACEFFECQIGDKCWEGKVMIVGDTQKKYYELIVSGYGSRFHILVGSYAYGFFLCIPSRGIGCEISHLDDYFWNVQSLEQYLSRYDAHTIAMALDYLTFIIDTKDDDEIDDDDEIEFAID